VSLDWIYWAISWILLFWHSTWNAIGVPAGTVLGTNWSWILAIVFVVVTVRVILFPVFVKQIKSQRALQKLQPKVKELQQKYGNDRETFQMELMKLYKEEKANPLMGCLPMFLQIPVFLGLFWVLRRIDPWQTVNTTLYGWTQEEWESAAAAKLFGAPIVATFMSPERDLAEMGASGITVKIVAGILVLTMMTTTYLTSRQMILKTGWSEDPQQRMVQKLMLYGIPASLLVSGVLFPIGVIIYWVVNNLFSLGQQQWVLRKFPPPGTVKAGAGARAGAGGQVKSGGRADRAKRGQPQKPVVDGKALAPKPGAKPVHPKKGRRPAKRKG
jgi:YidC/Oxa1 family membrane protein insertase